MKVQSNSDINKIGFDSNFKVSEQLPKNFIINFESILLGEKWLTKVSLDDTQLGDIINDNSKTSDYYRFHDIFHYSFAAILGWSPCARAMMKRKRKSDYVIDEVEDGARATITEEAISMIVFNEAKRKKYFEGASAVSKTTLRIIKEMTEDFEVKVRSAKEWEDAILKSYEIFRLLMVNGGGSVEFDAFNKAITYSPLSASQPKSPIQN
ncbi:nucleotide pyrophosphohydrolase [Mucilaginibacter sp. 21P]|uniref:hypothetical protein n=1 Tax=Mucilaginibacter sp. 21P TaxID=2778902 RepID=UPI001C592EF1|nr:hypothetical protein [Mucilaginibacter sp. 21P]QXV63983.1 nucleotide pyrophosphohydrolase [Mucilaginibacter sp. 21P]